MKRRQALEFTAALFGGAVVGSEFFLSGCSRKEKSTVLFSNVDVALLDEIGETILPETTRSPGAKSAYIGEFVKTIVTDCYDDQDTQTFITGIAAIRQKSKDEYAGDFMDISPENKAELLTILDQEARNYPREEGIHYYTMMKQLTIWGYFTSEPGATKALRYNPIPGSYRGCVPYQSGDKAWAS